LQAVLGDLSAGMVAESRSRLVAVPGFSFLCLDVQSIPFRSGSFDAVIANHMLYHVPDLQHAVSEIARVLKPGGQLFAATNGFDHMRELHALIRNFVSTYPERNPELLRFTLENASSLLGGEFTRVEMRTYKSDLRVTEVEPLIAYIQSIGDIYLAVEEKVLSDLRDYLQVEFTAVQNGKFLFPITKSQGLVIGIK
jgi:SAM-dependent methyltransferase